MAKIRQDAWSHEDDLLLAETVLRHIREGSTQLNAFEEVGDELNRTSAACGFRWNAEVRNKYISAIDLAKRQRKEKKRKQSGSLKTSIAYDTHASVQTEKQSNALIMEQDKEVSSSQLSLDIIIHYLQSIQHEMYDVEKLKAKANALESENNRLIQQITALEKEASLQKSKLTTVEEDYKTFIEIMERARKMAVFKDSNTSNHSPTFKMDKNGNLEQIIQSNTN